MENLRRTRLKLEFSAKSMQEKPTIRLRWVVTQIVRWIRADKTCSNTQKEILVRGKPLKHVHSSLIVRNLDERLGNCCQFYGRVLCRFWPLLPVLQSFSGITWVVYCVPLVLERRASWLCNVMVGRFVRNGSSRYNTCLEDRCGCVILSSSFKTFAMLAWNSISPLSLWYILLSHLTSEKNFYFWRYWKLVTGS